jgi:chromosome partitioning protein
MTTVISFINYKGWVGKTTTAYCVSSSLAQHYGQRVLMIDIDPQTNLTFLCASIEQWQTRKEGVGTITDLYRHFTLGQTLDVKRFIWKDTVNLGRHPISSLDLIPCDIDLLGEALGGGQVNRESARIPLLRTGHIDADEDDFLGHNQKLRQTLPA